jgi:putative transposase
MFKKKQNLCLDKGYDFQETKDDVSRKDTYHTFDIEENNLQQNAVIIILREEDGLLRELNSWHNRFRKLLVRYEKKLENYFALACLGCCILIYRRMILG